MARAGVEIENQQVAMGKWIRSNLPPDARILANDVGALGWLARRPLFDLVGLVTPGQAAAYAEGPGSVFERFENLSPDALPTHMALYPDWLGIPALLGPVLARFDLRHPPIAAGEQVAVVAKADWALLHSGDAPRHRPESLIVSDVLDVADLSSETTHAFTMERPAPLRGARFQTLLFVDRASTTEPIADGGRKLRGKTRFTLKPHSNEGSTLIIRLTSNEGAFLEVWVNAHRIEGIDVLSDPHFVEETVRIPPSETSPLEITLRPLSGGPIAFYHAWLMEESPGAEER